MGTWEQDLIRRVQAGDPEAFSPLVERYAGPLYASVPPMLGDADAAADVIQDAFITTFENIHHYNPDHRFFSWIYRIAQNGALNRINRRRFRRPLPEQEVPSPVPGPDAWVEAREQADHVTRAMALLADKYRVQLVLRHYLDLSYEEIASVTQLPVSTVRSRLHTARMLLKQELIPLEKPLRKGGTGPAAAVSL